MRCVHEAALYAENCFLTLTYDDAHVPAFGSLDRSAFPKFMKRLRKRFPGERIRYFHCGEYGERTQRPHYHALLFGFDFADKYPWSYRSGRPCWRSPTLEVLWPFGQSELGSVTFESAAYVARYVVKKVSGALAYERYSRVDVGTGEIIQISPEYTTMSRRPGIGREWYERFKSEVYPADEVVVSGRVMKPPRYYDVLFEAEDPEGFEALSRKRVVESEARLAQKEEFALAKLNHFSRRDAV